MEAVLATTAPRRRIGISFIAKLGAALLLVAAADWLFLFQRIGSTIGLYAAALLILLLATRPALRRGPALAAATAALVYALALADSPSWLGWGLFWIAASLAVLLTKGGFDDGWRWTKRLLIQWLCIPLGLVHDAAGLRAARRRFGALPVGERMKTLWLPIAGSLVFLALFTAANPMIEQALVRLDMATAVAGLSLTRLSFWILAAMLLWSLFRPRLARLSPALSGEPIDLPGFSLASVRLSLLAFNLIFALENGLDLAFLWTGARLPEGVNYAEYAHRGAYPLIATALLAGLFVLITLRPGSPFADNAVIRRLVYLWIGQNVLLVASTILRTLNYVDAYSLTVLRIAALLWMGLVAAGLILICLRIWLRRSGAWLINANFAAAGLLLTACAFVDLSAVAARWNVVLAREVGGPGVPLDRCYLDDLGAASLLPLIALESRPLPPAFRERVTWLRNLQMDRLANAQADWRGWTWRGARRLAEAEARIAARRLPRFAAGARNCGGAPFPLTASTRG